MVSPGSCTEALHYISASIGCCRHPAMACSRHHESVHCKRRPQAQTWAPQQCRAAAALCHQPPACRARKRGYPARAKRHAERQTGKGPQPGQEPGAPTISWRALGGSHDVDVALTILLGGLLVFAEASCSSAVRALETSAVEMHDRAPFCSPFSLLRLQACGSVESQVAVHMLCSHA